MRALIPMIERIWRIAYLALCVAILVFLVAPMLVIAPFSLNAEPYFSFPIPALSGRWYAEVFTAPAWRNALFNSLSIAAPTMILSTALGTLAAVGLTYENFPGKGVIIALILSPMMTPHIIIGLGLFFFYVELGVVGTRLGMILAHTTLAVPFVVMTVSATLANFNMNVMRAAAIHGAPPLTAFRLIMLPLILPGVLSGALFAFMVSFDELIVALLISGVEHRTLPRQIWSGVRESVSPAIMAVATLLVLLAGLLMAVTEWLSRRSERFRSAATVPGR